MLSTRPPHSRRPGAPSGALGRDRGPARGLLSRAALAAAAVAVVLGAGTGVAAAAPAPSLAWSPAGPYSFGTLAPGATSAPVVFTADNTGGAATSALTITVTQAQGFTITADHCTGKSLGPGRSCTVTLTYTAPAAGGQSSQATLAATAPGKPAVTATATLTGASSPTSHLYWTDSPASPSTGAVIEAGLDGSNPQSIVPGQAEPAAMAIDGNNIYWANFGDGTIMEANLDGSNAHAIITGQDQPSAVAVDGNNIYWTNFGTGQGGQFTGTVNECSLTDCTTPIQLATGQAFPDGVAVDSSNGTIYWTNASLDIPIGTVNECSLSNCANPQAIVTGLWEPGGVAVDSSNDTIYWANYLHGSIWEANLDGSNAQIIATNQDYPNQVAVTGSNIYWTNGGTTATNGTIMEANLDGSNPTQLVSGQSDPWGIAVGPN